MRTLLTILLAAASCTTLRADFSYQTSTQITGGSLFPPSKPIVTNNLIKGSRMATVVKDHISVLNLDNETIIDIDLAKKQYSVMTFAQVKQALDEASAKAPQPAAFQISTKSTGQSKAVGVLNAKEFVLTMTAPPVKDAALAIVVDTWLLAVPGYQEVKEFHRKLAAKLGYAFASGLWQIALTEPQSLEGFAETARQLNKAEGVPVESTMKMGRYDAPPQPAAKPDSPGLARAALNRLSKLGRKKSDPPPPADPNSLIETYTELGSFSSGPADASKFEVPAGFKKVDPTLPHAH